VPSVVMFFLNRLSWNSIEGLQLGNVFNLMALRDDSHRDAHLYFACAWLVVEPSRCAAGLAEDPWA
jgi:hypothetical protein